MRHSRFLFAWWVGVLASPLLTACNPPPQPTLPTGAESEDPGHPGSMPAWVGPFIEQARKTPFGRRGSWLSIAPPASARVGTTRPDQPKPQYLTIYDVRDLLHPLSKSPADGSSVLVPPPEEDRRVKVEGILTLLRTTVLPDTWTPSGDANILENSGFLVVQQTATGHREMGTLLAQLREHLHLGIALEVHGLVATPDTLARALQQARIDLPLTDNGNAGVYAVEILNDGRSSTLLKALASKPKKPPVRQSLRNGRELYMGYSLTPGNRTEAVRFVLASSPDYQGLRAKFSIRTTATADREYVIVTLHPVLRGPPEQPFPLSPTTARETPSAPPTTAPVDAEIGLGEPSVPEVRTTVMVPVNGWLLVAMPETWPDPPPDRTKRVVLLLFRMKTWKASDSQG